jgi:hypothetical protein
MNMKKLLLLSFAILIVSTVFSQTSAEKKLAFANKIAYKKAHPVVHPLKNSGADTFGYNWKDNTEPGCSYSWHEISGTGLNLEPGIDEDDEQYGPFDIGFNFPFYENTFSQFYFSTNGAIMFENDSWDYEYYNIPSDDAEQDKFIAWHWTDLEMLSDNNAAVYFQNFGSYSIIEFENYSDIEDASYIATMQVVLYQNGNIELRYKDVDLGLNYDNYYSVGIQDSPTTGMGIAYDVNDFFSNNKSILITKTNAVPVSKYSILFLFLFIGVFTAYRFFR